MTDDTLAKIKAAAARVLQAMKPCTIYQATTPMRLTGGEMSSDYDDDLKQFIDSFPQAVWWKRLPIIRHFRAAWLSVQLARHYAMWESVGAIPWGASKDYAIRDAIWRGEK